MKRYITLIAIAAAFLAASSFASAQEKAIPTPPDQQVRIFSHRGGRMEFDENTLSAFEASYKAGYRGYETDVRMTSDGVLVIMHDHTLERVSDGKGTVEHMTADQIRKLNTKGGHKIMFLDELLSWLKSKKDITYVEFELKTKPENLYPTERLHEYCDKLYKAVMAVKPEGATYLFTSGDYRGIMYMKEKYSDAQFLIITGKPVNDETIALCKALGVYRIGAKIEGTSRKAVQKAHEEGITVSLWPGTSPADAVFGAYLGADYLCTDVPVAVKTFLDTKTPWIKAVY